MKNSLITRVSLFVGDLCNKYAYFQLNSDNLERAIKWWIRAAKLQFFAGSLNSYIPFMYLSCVAGYCGLNRESKKLLDISDTIMLGIGLNDSADLQLRALIMRSDKKRITVIIKSFTDEIDSESAADEIESESQELPPIYRTEDIVMNEIKSLTPSKRKRILGIIIMVFVASALVIAGIEGILSKNKAKLLEVEMKKRKGLSLDQALLGHWQHGHWQQGVSHMYFSEREISVITIPQDRQVANFSEEAGGKRSPYKITQMQPNRNMVTFSMKYRGVASMSGLKGWGPRIEVDLDYELVFDQSKRFFDLYRHSLSNNELTDEGKWQYIDSTKYPTVVQNQR